MVKNNESKVEITIRNIKYYTDRNYICKVGDVISINIDTMPKNSHNKVIAICETCKRETELKFSKYNKNKANQGYYACKKCCYNKRKITNLERYGVENYTQTEEMRNNNKIWMSSEEFKKKSKERLKEIYGVDHYSKTDEFKKDFSIKIKESVKQKKEQGIYDCPLTWEGNREKRDKGMIDKYGSSYSYDITEIIEKRKKTIRKRQENLFNIDKDANFKGIEYKIIEYKLYRNKVRRETEKSRKELFENWDGYDYYDHEYIKDETIHYNNKSAPTIDHKISCFHGFLNNIPVEEIANINNLCITKRRINGQKSNLNENEFKK